MATIQVMYNGSGSWTKVPLVLFLNVPLPEELEIETFFGTMSVDKDLFVVTVTAVDVSSFLFSAEFQVPMQVTSTRSKKGKKKV